MNYAHALGFLRFFRSATGARLSIVLATLAGCSLPQFQHPNAAADAFVATSPGNGTALEPGFVVESGNYYARVTDRRTWQTTVGPDNIMVPGTTHPLWGPITLAAGSLAASGMCWGDARIMWDPGTARWYRSASWQVPGVDRQLCLGVSVTTDPRGGWWIGEVGVGTGGPNDMDFPRLSFTDDHIVILPYNNRNLTFVDKWRAVTGDFGGVIARDIGLLGGAIPVTGIFGSGAEAMFVKIQFTYVHDAGYPQWLVYRHNVAANTTVIQGQPWYADPSYATYAPTAYTPDGTIESGYPLQEAWLARGMVNVTGCLSSAEPPGVNGIPTAYLAVLSANTDRPPLNVLRSNVYTIFPSVAVSQRTGTIILSAIQTDTVHYPTHVMALTRWDNPGPLTFFSVQDAAASQHLAAVTPGGNGSGPVPPPEPGDVKVRGPDYLWATADQADGVWFVGMWTAGGAWWLHTTWWH